MSQPPIRIAGRTALPAPIPPDKRVRIKRFLGDYGIASWL
jgi:hypothetical protein